MTIYTSDKVFPFTYSTSLLLAVKANAQAQITLASDSIFELNQITVYTGSDGTQLYAGDGINPTPGNPRNLLIRPSYKSPVAGSIVRYLTSTPIIQANYGSLGFNCGNAEKYPVRFEKGGIFFFDLTNLDPTFSYTLTISLIGYKFYD